MPVVILYTLLTFIALNAVFNLLYLYGLSRIKEKTRVTPPPPGDPVSVVIAASNEESNLKTLIPALLSQQYADFEIIIAVNNTSDGSLDYLQNVQNEHPRVLPMVIGHIPDNWNSKKYALNQAIKSARHDRIVLIDADCVPVSQNWLNELSGAYNSETQIVLGYSHYRKEGGVLNALIRFETIFTGIQYLGASGLGLPYMGVGRNLSYSKTFFLKKGGFNGFNSITGGDDDLFVNHYANGRNTVAILSPDSLTISNPKTSWRSWIQQKTRHLSVGKHYSIMSKLLLGIHALLSFGTWIALIYGIMFLSFSLMIAFILGYLPMLISSLLLMRKSGIRFPIYQHPLLSTIYPFFHIFVGLRGLLTRRIEWTN